MEKFKKVKKRGLSSDDSRRIRKQGHDDAGKKVFSFRDTS